jgi:hypothetical protein
MIFLPKGGWLKIALFPLNYNSLNANKNNKIT